MLNILFNNKIVISSDMSLILSNIHASIHERLRIEVKDYYLIQNGKFVKEDTLIEHGNVGIVLRLFGGKGGFGSMLRAIGAQIEKTTNREACRDLSGRRLRDINEEKRLKKWITQQTEREEEAAQRKQRKLERLCEKPKHQFKDESYDNERSQLPEMVENAVTQGLKASCSNTTLKRKPNDTETTKKKRKLWIDEEDISSDESNESGDDNDTKSYVSTNTETNSSDNVENSVASDKNQGLKILNEESDRETKLDITNVEIKIGSDIGNDKENQIQEQTAENRNV